MRYTTSRDMWPDEAKKIRILFIRT